MMKLRVILSLLLIIALITTLQILINPLRRSSENIRENILRLTPMGTDIHDVIDVIKGREDWRVRYISFEGGFVRPGPPIPEWPVTETSAGHSVVGEQSIRVFIGSYRAWYKFFLATFADIFWGFDEDGKLIYVYVWKVVAGL